MKERTECRAMSERVCALPGCGKSLKGMHWRTKYCCPTHKNRVNSRSPSYKEYQAKKRREPKAKEYFSVYRARPETKMAQRAYSRARREKEEVRQALRQAQERYRTKPENRERSRVAAKVRRERKREAARLARESALLEALLPPSEKVQPERNAHLYRLFCVNADDNLVVDGRIVEPERETEQAQITVVELAKLVKAGVCK